MASTQLMSLAGWYFLPNLVTGYVQTALYAIFIRAGDPKPTPGTPRFARDRRNIHIAVILAYLIYTIYEADYQLQTAGDFYRLLGVPHDASEKAIQSKFRRLTVQFHPDKVSGEDKDRVQQTYVLMKVAKDTLADPAKRFAYDRFGPDILRWQNCKLIKDFIFSGMQQMMGYYIGSGAVLILLGVLGYLRQGMFWRYLVMASLFVIEMHTITRPYLPIVLTNVVNPILATTGFRQPYLPFQLVTLLRKLTVTFFIAMSQLGPLLQDPKQAAIADGPGVPAQVLDRVDAIANATESEISRLMALELTPFAQDPSTGRELRASLKEWLVQNTIRNDPEVKMAIQRVFDQRRAEGAPDAMNARLAGQ
ncbi:Putative DnaJ domain, Chaperone J-domain superfamily [Septoria linicola]|uniref:DnaJ domain, Chaperone J-domain superfamily n=1 Tax=Septoria linicola TaxID=215465 RepID=A0A9Q9AHG0_9PEZI|nr:putative DnaJ domain, Chaperone J-domain superfamily [Septoria linicola]USW49267.1 Putative DnaJ domain, Chaperone J-domain superfamily [Septoria linicola]